MPRIHIYYALQAHTITHIYPTCKYEYCAHMGHYGQDTLPVREYYNIRIFMVKIFQPRVIQVLANHAACILPWDILARVRVYPL